MAAFVSFVTPGRAAGASPESSNERGACLWIPGSPAKRAPRNDKGGS